VTAFNQVAIVYSLAAQQDFMHVAVAPCSQTAVAAGATSGNLLYLQITVTTPALSLIQNLNPAYSSTPNCVVYLSSAVLLVTDSNFGVDEYHLTPTNIFWYRRLTQTTGLSMLMFFANSNNFGLAVNTVSKSVQLFSYNSKQIVLISTMFTYSTAATSLAINSPFTRLSVVGANFINLYSNCQQNLCASG
jgi:hypothetical protein